MKKLAFALAGLVLLASGSEALAQCSTGAQNPNTNGTHQIGLRSDGLTLGKGQSFTLDCDASMVSVEFRMMLPDEPYMGVPQLAAGDPVVVTLMKPDGTYIAEAVHTVAAGDDDVFMLFDFSGADFALAAGDYVACCTLDGRAAFFRKDADAVPGELYTGIDGVWSANADADATFRIIWDPESGLVSADRPSWSELKTRFK